MRKQLLAAAIAFTIGSLFARLYSYSEISDLRVRAECAYHEGKDEGYNDAIQENAERLTRF